ncbi:TorF family putative porin [Verrucomicrobiaceae bacterium 227]
MKKTLSILAIGSGLFLGQAQAEIESEFHVGYNSEYVFRGIDLGDDAYEYGLDFAGSCDCGLDWSAGIWSISPDGTDGNVDELDIYAAISKDLGFASVAVGFTAYTYDGGGDDDAEVFLGFSAEPIGGLDAGLTVFFGTDGILEEQVLLEGSLGYTFAVSDKVAANVGVVYGYVADEGLAGYASEDGSAYFSATLSFDVALSDDLTFSPYVSYIEGEEKRIGPGVQDGVIGGAKVSFAF